MIVHANSNSFVVLLTVGENDDYEYTNDGDVGDE